MAILGTDIIMSLDGTYGFVYSGISGVGIGVFVIKNGAVTGRDMANVSYQGSATERADGSIGMDLRLQFPPGTFMVQGTSPQDVPHERHIQVQVAAGFGDGAPFKADLPGGSLHMMVQRVPDHYAPAAFKGISIQIAP